MLETKEDMEHRSMLVKKSLEYLIICLSNEKDLYRTEIILERERAESIMDYSREKGESQEKIESYWQKYEKTAKHLSKINDEIREKIIMIERFMKLGIENITLDEKTDKEFFDNELKNKERIVKDMLEVSIEDNIIGREVDEEYYDKQIEDIRNTVNNFYEMKNKFDDGLDDIISSGIYYYW